MDPNSDRGLLALSVDSMPNLKPNEKSAMFGVLDGMTALSTLRKAEAQLIVGRHLERWEPLPAMEFARLAARAIARSGLWALASDEGEYPDALREIHDPPFLLYGRGSALPGGSRSVAIVGTRRPSGDGEREAGIFASQMASLGIGVISGLARGIDAASHRGALAAGGKTWAVLGSGIDTVYPRAHARLASRMIEAGGGLVSEYPPGTAPAKWRFPARNRIIAGLARATVVVEAPTGSGALITASFANDEGRDVCVLEKMDGRRGNEGCARLASDGARMLGTAKELLADWAVAW